MNSSSSDFLESLGLAYVGDDLGLHGIALHDVAKQFETPLYLYSAAILEQSYRTFDNALAFAPHHIAYAVKANGNLHLLRRYRALGASVDIVSGGELARALKAGFEPHQIVFSGVGKTQDELLRATRLGIRSIHVESEQELDALEAIAREHRLSVDIALRVNPDVDAKTHPYIATGLEEAKFGIGTETVRGLARRLVNHEWVRLKGLTCHIGSQMSSPSPLEEAARHMAKLVEELRSVGLPLAFLDMGGGWPIRYGEEHPTHGAQCIQAFPQALRQGLQSLLAGEGVELWVELGRSLIGNAGFLLTRVQYIKKRTKKDFAIVDAAMTELLRPALYQAHHTILPVRASSSECRRYDIVGPVCETGDFLALNRELSQLLPGDLLIVCGAGAYAASMGSTYNARPLAAEVLLDHGQLQLIRRRQRVEELWTQEEDIAPAV